MRLYDSQTRPHPFFEEAIELARYRDLVRIWAKRNLTLRYKRSVLGVLWTLIEPMVMMVVLSIVFTTIFKFAVENYAVYLLSGILMFGFFDRSTNQMIDEMISSEAMARSVYCPRTAFALAAVSTHLVNWLLALIPLAGVMAFLGADFSLSLVTIVPGLLLTAAFATGIGLLVATIGSHFHDFRLMYQVLLTVWFYATPVIYPVQIVPEKWRWLIGINPLTHLCDVVRYPAFKAEIAPGNSWAIATAAGLGVLALGWWIFTRHKDELNYL